MTTCKDCYRRNPATGYCPVRTYEVEEDHEPCGSYATPPRDMNEPKEEATKTCKRCGKELPLSSFSRNRNGMLGVCKDCMKAAQKKGAKPAKPAKPEKPAEPEAPKEEPAHPEPYESYDERIRKELLHYILYNAKGVSEEQEHSWIAYLERQKEQKPVGWIENEKFKEAISAAISGTTASEILEANGVKLFDALTYLETQKAQKPAEWSSDEDVRFILKDAIRILRDRGYQVEASIIVAEKL